MNIRDFLKNLIAEGQSQSAISRKAGVSQPTINNIIHGAENPHTNTLKKIAVAYGKDQYFFMGRDNSTDNTGHQLSKDEARLLEAFRNLDERRQERFLDTIEDMVMALKESHAKGRTESTLTESNSGRN